MSTLLDNLVRSEKVSRWDPDLGPRRHSQRTLFVTAEFVSWANSLPTTLATSRQRLVSPAAELNEIAASFVAGDKALHFLRRIDPPRGQGVLRLNTSSFRLAGWCPAPQTLVLAQGALADDTHGTASTPPAVRLRDVGKRVAEIRKALGFKNWETGELYELFPATD